MKYYGTSRVDIELTLQNALERDQKEVICKIVQDAISNNKAPNDLKTQLLRKRKEMTDEREREFKRFTEEDTGPVSWFNGKLRRLRGH